MTHYKGVPLSRRRFTGLAVTSAACGPIARASAMQSNPDSNVWEFTDDKGVTIALPSMPARLVMDVNIAAPLWDFGVRPTGLFGWNVLADGTLGDAGGNIDPAGIPIAGNVSATIDVEKLITLDPELVLTLTWEPGNPDEYWSIDDPATLAQVKEVAPILAMSATGRADDNMIRLAELAASLGADLDSDDLATARSECDAAFARFAEVVEAKKDLTVLFIAPVAEETYVASPADWADLNMFSELGLNTYMPDVEPGDFWQPVSHEMALTMSADVIFSSTRNEAWSLDEIKGSPSWGLHPAVKAGQLFGWNQDFIQSYQGIGAALDTISDGMNRSQKLT